MWCRAWRTAPLPAQLPFLVMATASTTIHLPRFLCRLPYLKLLMKCWCEWMIYLQINRSMVMHNLSWYSSCYESVIWWCFYVFLASLRPLYLAPKLQPFCIKFNVVHYAAFRSLHLRFSALRPACDTTDNSHYNIHPSSRQQKLPRKEIFC